MINKIREIKLPKSKHKHGYTNKEVEKIIKKYKVDYNKFWQEFGINTCAVDEKGNTLYYYVDIERTLAKLLLYRTVSPLEWD